VRASREFALIDVKLTLKLRFTKTLPKMEISDELDAHINEGTKLSELCKADVVRQALRIGLPQFAARFQPAPIWLEERIREALAEPAQPVTPAHFKAAMKAIAGGMSSCALMHGSSEMAYGSISLVRRHRS
jgi:hypothetical protein